jgi:CRP/FNR family transcriptional regulator, cyclic AMP receptor protein
MMKRTSSRGRLESFDKRTVLRAHPFFKGLDDQIIEQLIPHAIMRKVKKGTVLFRKGDVGTNLYAVCAGAVRISAPSENGKDAVFNLIIPGEIFGEIAFIDGGQRTADAVATENGELMVIERRDFIPVLRRNPEIAMRLLEILCGRLRRTSGQVEDIVFFDVQVRLAKALLHLYRHSAQGAPNKHIRITQQDISQMIGASRETTNRELRNWQRRKWLELERAGLVILAPEELERLVLEAAC